jgi:hypothetical protein
MNSTRKKPHASHRCITAVALGIFVTLVLLSCPNPIDSKLANQVEDELAPLVTIITPDPDLKYYYPSEILIEGIVKDYVDNAGGTAGEIASLTYEEQFNKRIAGVIDVAADGSFSFTIDTLRPEIIQGTQYIVVTAADWNGNTTEIIVTAYDKTTGPLIGVDITSTDYTSNPAAGLTYTITGVVGVPTFYLTYDVEPESGALISGEDIIYNQIDGEFSFNFTPSAAGVSGELKFILKAEDNDGPTSYIFYLQDDPVGPAYDVASAVTADNAYVDLVFSEGIYHAGGTAPLATDFSLGWSGGSGSVTAVALGGFVGTPAAGDTSVRLALGVTGTPAGDETLSITGSNITDAVGNPLSPESLNRNLTDKIAPVVMQVGVEAGYENDAYNHLDPALPIPVIVTFDGPVTVTSPMSMTLNSGATVTCASGTDTTELTFNYTVSAGENTPPATALNYTSTTALTGSVTDGGGNTVTNPALPDPAGPNALGVENIVIDTLKPGAPTVTILDGDGKITKSENDADVPFTITGEAGTRYTLASDASWELEAGSMSGTLPVSGLELRALIISGTVTVSATLTDAAGNVSASGSDTSTASLLAPNPPDFVTNPHAVNDAADLDWVWESGGSGLNVGNGNYRYKVNDPDLTVGALTQTDTSGNVYYSTFVPAPDVDGGYTLYVQEQNNLDNWSDSASCELILDRGDPWFTSLPEDAQIVEAQNSSGMSESWTLSYLAVEYDDDLDKPPDLTIDVDGDDPPSAFGVGYHTITFTLTDHAGNTAAATRTLTVKNTVTSPTSSTKVAANGSVSVNWATDGTGDVTIDLYKGGVKIDPALKNTADDGSTNCTIPAGSTAGTNYTIRVTDDSTGMYSESAQFTIENVTVTSPDGAETWGIGTTQTVTWTSSRTGDVKIVLRKGTSDEATLADNMADTGSFSWTIGTGLSAGTNYRIRVTDKDTSDVDTSDGDFTLEEITVSVTFPNGGESWAQNSSQTITWDATGGGSVKIELFKGGALNATITGSTPNDGSHPWTVPAAQTVGADYSIRVTSIDVGTVSDDSDAVFSVTVP